MEPKATALRSAGDVEADILHSVQAIIRELDQDKPTFQRSQGMFRWTLHKKIERDPYNSMILARILIDELEQAMRENKPYLIPLLNTLLYTIIQAVYIPDDLYEKAYKFCKELLSWARPYCTIGYEYAVMLHAERKAPGALHQKLVVSEHCLKNESFSHGEKVFVFADPDLVSKEVCDALRTEVHSATASQPSAVYKMHVIQHCLQAALGESCDLELLLEALQSKPHCVIERYFQEVVGVMYHSCSSKKEVPATRSKHSSRLHQLYTNILGSTHQVTPLKGRLRNIPLPNPDVRLVMWREDDALWQELEEFVTGRLCSEESSMNSDMDNAEMNEHVNWSNNEQTRLSVLSTDSGIVRDCGDAFAAQDTESPQDSMLAHSPHPETCEVERPKLSRRHGMKIKHTGSDKQTPLLDFIDGASSLQRRSGRNALLFNLKVQRAFTARVVMIGNDCILGRLAKAFHSLRKREVQRLFLTSKLDVEFYYVPVLNTKWASASLSKVCPSLNGDHSCELSRYLGIIDPWYHSNIHSLQTMVPELATMSASCRQPSRSDPFIVDVITYYVRMGHQPVCFQIYSVKLVFAQEMTVFVEDVFLIQLQ
ncbi:phosphoinositide 3-kinase regulatory subunit 6 [Callorhinchus milii]|uniref:phosphoinositide 3-kinase regulatory subunit 6 n=1 Tax=Callorhinchus milii TaxID=7868 RepID=UPI001C3FDA41|nr:phosphoinositide 3-kinase regulatory subunit 6 [Callorhinchus milii]